MQKFDMNTRRMRPLLELVLMKGK